VNLFGDDVGVMVEVTLSEDDCEDSVWSAAGFVHVRRRHSPASAATTRHGPVHVDNTL